MPIKQDIDKSIQHILHQEFLMEKVGYVPDADDCKFNQGFVGLEFEAIATHIDIRTTAPMTNIHDKSIMAKAHLSYFHAISKMASMMGGTVRSFSNGNALVFFNNDSIQKLNQAMDASLIILYMLKNMKYAPNTHYAIEFGMGIDMSSVLCLKPNQGSGQQELIWLGDPVARAAQMSHLRASPHHLAVSETVYHFIRNDPKYINKNNPKEAFWTEDSFLLNNEPEAYYYMTHYDWK